MNGLRYLIGCALLLGLPLLARADGWVGLRNDSKTPIVVQASTVVNNRVVPGRLVLLYPGEVAWDCVVQPCVKSIAVYDPQQANRPLFEKKVPCGTVDLFFAVQVPPSKEVEFSAMAAPRRR
jgi:hypothetical protein